MKFSLSKLPEKTILFISTAAKAQRLCTHAWTQEEKSGVYESAESGESACA